MTLTDIAKILLDQNSSEPKLHSALKQFSRICSDISNLEPDPSYTAWSDDTFLSQGVAINPKAAAYCVKDFQRSVVFIRGVFAALQTLRSRTASATKTKVLYAGCGPFATLLLPLLPLLEPEEFDIFLLDIHQQSLDSVAKLIKALGLSDYKVSLVQADAFSYQHPGLLDLIIVETMQKALEQEPQFAVTANLANQLSANGLFLPEEITIELALAHLTEETELYRTEGKVDNERLLRAGKRKPISTLMTLSAANANRLLNQTDGMDKRDLIGQPLPAIYLDTVTIPDLKNLEHYQPLLFTRITVFGKHKLEDYQSSLTLPSRCVDLEPLEPGARYHASYVFGSYPKIHWQHVEKVK